MIHALAWFLIGYSDGLVYWIINQTEVTGYLLYIVPIIIIYLAYLVIFPKIRFTQKLLYRQILFLSFSIFLFFFQTLTIGEFYTLGYVQIMAMIGIILLITDIFEGNEAKLRPYFAHGILIIHYIICLYALLAWIVLRLTTIDISLYVVDIDSLSGFAVNRTSGLHREPSWAGYALASSYLGVLITRQHRMLLPQIVFLIAIAVTGAGVGLILASCFIAHHVLITKRGNLVMRMGILAGLGFLVMIVFSSRISDVINQNDPSSQMRLESTTVAMEVIAETFPLGTGFGNYQDYAVFDPNIWGNFLDLSEATYYKSDILALNFISELGFFGLILIIILIFNFTSRNNYLILISAIAMILTSGTVIHPAYFVLSAIVGLERGRFNRQLLNEPVRE